MHKKKISWVTPECFIDVDVYVINQICNVYDINWQIILDYGCSIDYEQYVNEILRDRVSLVHIKFLRSTVRIRDPRKLFQLLSIIKRAKDHGPDYYYIGSPIVPYGAIIYRCLLPRKKVLFPCHNVTTPVGAKNGKIAEIMTKLWLWNAYNVNVFSKSQQQVLNNLYPGKNTLLTYLAIKDYGEPTIKMDRNQSSMIRFLNFGNIVEYKRVDLLIEAGNILYERGYRNFRIRIAGNCKQWNRYEDLIKYPDVFELIIKRVPNEDVPNMFAESHYFVMPYQDIAQSGAITVAFRYNLPTIVSDIKPFEEFVENAVTGITFRSGDANDLADKMQFVIDQHKDIYKPLCENQRVFTEQNFSLSVIANRYVDFFESL